MTDKDAAASEGIVILASGGLDSSLLLHWASKITRMPFALMIDYGQKHVRELETAKKICDTLHVRYRVMKVDLGPVNSGLTGRGEGGLYQGVSEWHVPGRNTIFVGLAASLAESLGYRKIWYGANGEDRINQFPDCYQEWIHAMNQSLARAGSIPLELEAPLLGMRKTTIQELAMLEGIDIEETHSGYDE